MKLRDAMVCLECEEIFEQQHSCSIDKVSVNKCPSCGDTAARLSQWLPTMNEHDKEQEKLLKQANRELAPCIHSKGQGNAREIDSIYNPPSCKTEQGKQDHPKDGGKGNTKDMVERTLKMPPLYLGTRRLMKRIGANIRFHSSHEHREKGARD